MKEFFFIKIYIYIYIIINNDWNLFLKEKRPILVAHFMSLYSLNSSRCKVNIKIIFIFKEKDFLRFYLKKILFHL
jgi:hypothetical protein